MLKQRVVIVSQCQVSVNELKLLFEFMGENVAVCLNNDNWTMLLNDNDPLLLCVAHDALSHVFALYHELKHQNKIACECRFVVVAEPERIKRHYSAKELKNVCGYLVKPYRYAQLEQVLDSAQTAQVAKEERLAAGRSEVQDELNQLLVGKSRAIRRVRQLIRQVAKSEVNVLILGCSGTGKEVVSQAIHRASARTQQAFVPVNCGAIPADLLESELFGHEKGAFTGAIASRQGRFELAQKGTLFLDEIGDMPLNMQVKLLRVLQERTFERVGSNKALECDVRVIAATHRNLEELIEEGLFREDLFYRLNVFPIEMPSLAERSEDIPLLIKELVSRIQREGRGRIRFTTEALARLKSYHWPGNVRELANLVERLTVSYANRWVDVPQLPHKFLTAEDIEACNALDESDGPLYEETAPIDPIDIEANMVGPSTVHLPGEGVDLKSYLTTIEANLIQAALDQSNGVVAHAAKRLSIRRTTLVEKIRKLNLAGNQSEELSKA
ncbi:AAA family ATPase [Piscirickettsia salmonis]|uniref:Nitrogen assimilation regulatory protein n=1 Tax=Piscirickettsia salmonis TaxID=1238 RepID=A0A9Q6LQA9_PISSA|nr:sigma-54 dependent transcriptional regulator [Piscirickettsia salmonis]ALA26145.1 ATPase AAA [Piscirickettsia salmonis]APS43590.1 AAA family ATPase [Piscirickettsia salmonis]APS46944.1 AAA family ATPase [Piscirickettsia salmonis]APS51605.1 AAA family ATPase [Piscirickettsia salmonis]APS54821.1 AAA family ATPase [Piscirickettsia salmonis]